MNANALDALNAVITTRELEIIDHKVRFRCACGSVATADLLTGQATCRCGVGKVEEFTRRVKVQAAEEEWKRERKWQGYMNGQAISRARKRNGIWR